MAEVLVEYSEAITGPDGRRYAARAVGSEHGSNLWQGWLEFLPLDDGEPMRTARETTQPNRQDTEYWATGLTPIYLEGALARTLTQTPKIVVPPSLSPAPAGDSILNPFSVYRKGEDLLRRQLGALSARHLVNIIRDYELSDEEPASLNRRPAPVLIETIVASVRARAELPAR